MKNSFKLFYNIIFRIIAAFTASALGVIGAGAVAGISTIKAMSVAGITAVASVIEKLARGFMDDGKLTIDEINSAFSAIDTQSKTAADLQVEARQNGVDITIKADGSTVRGQSAPADASAPVATAAQAAPAVVDPNYN